MSQVGSFMYNIKGPIAIDTILFCMSQYTLFGILEPDSIWSYNLSTGENMFYNRPTDHPLLLFFYLTFYGV